jgi:hypothetical protein
MTWDPFNAPDDDPIIGGTFWPGTHELTKIERKRNLQKVTPIGANGARVISLGRYLTEFTNNTTLADATDYQGWLEDVAPMLAKIPVGAKAKAIAITWAPVNVLGVDAFLIENIRGPIQGDDGIWSVEVDCVEWKPMPAPAVSAPIAPDKPIKPQTDLQKQNAALIDQVRTRWK